MMQSRKNRGKYQTNASIKNSFTAHNVSTKRWKHRKFPQFYQHHYDAIVYNFLILVIQHLNILYLRKCQTPIQKEKIIFQPAAH